MVCESIKDAVNERIMYLISDGVSFEVENVCVTGL